MNYKIGLFITYLVYLFTILGTIYAFLAPHIAHAWFWEKEIVIDFSQEQTKTLDSEIDRLSVKYSVDPKVARDIIRCESQMYGSAVNYNRSSDGTIWSEDRGPFQINDYYHQDTMTKLGLDYYNEWDSLEYGFILLSTQGLSPWSASKGCWGSKI